MVGVVFAARHAERCAKLITISAGLRPDGWGTATRHLQRELVRDGLRNGDVATGMMRARQLGMLTYRGRDELDTRFGKLLPHLDRPPVAEYLDHHGRRFAERFPVKTFLLLSEAIDRESMGDAQAVREACARVNAETIVVGVPGDMLFPWALQVELHRALQAAGADSSLWKLESLFGHDAFLADQDRLADLLRGAGAFGEPLKTASRPRFEGVGVEPVREIRIGLVGCGTVGRGLLEMIDRQSDAVADRYGVKFRVSRIAVRDVTKDRGPRAAGIPITDRALELVSDPEVDVVVEAAGGTAVEPILVAALAAGKPVVTANKELLASKLAELGVLAQRTETPLYCEAAAAAAIPIVRHLSHRADEIDSLWGIVNATCNFVMTRLEQGDLTLDEAIAEAQRLGFAEADPSADLDGHDAAAKLSILAYRAFGAWVRPDGFLVRGIRDIDPADCDLAESMGFRIRQIARAVRINGALDMAVEPLLLPSWHLLASVEEEYNAVYLRCVSSGDLSLFGKGAGALPTATAMLGDLIDLAQDNSVRWPVPHALPVARDGSAVAPAPRRHYLRITGQPHPGLERKFEGLVRRLGLVVQNRATRGDDGSRRHRVHDLAEHGHADRRSRRRRSSSWRASSSGSASECWTDVGNRDREPGSDRRLARSAVVSRRASAARGDGAGDAQPARRDRRARAAHRHSLSPSRRTDRAARSARLDAGHRVAGRQGRIPVRERRLLVGAAAPLRALRHDRDRAADREAEGARARHRRRWSATRACRPRRWPSTR